MRKNIFYNGNPRIKKAGVNQRYNKKQLAEYVKCRDDIVYFISNYCKIISLDEGLILFDLRDYQKRMILSYDDNRFNITLTSRQIGKTTVVAAYLMHYLIFRSNKSAVILAQKAATAREILSRVKRMLEGLPFFLQPGVFEYNKGSVEFGNGSIIMAASTSSSSIRGFTFNLVYLDEFAFVENADDFYTSTYPVISSGKDTKIIITSTPLGMNLFYKIWTDSKNNNNAFKGVRVDWWEVPHYDEAWKEETINNIGLKKFRQEYGNSFYGSSDTLIEGGKLESLVWSKPIDVNDKFNIYERPKKDHQYVITVDVSEGGGNDYSVANVTDITSRPYKQVALFRHNETTPLLFPDIIYNFALTYNNAVCLIETNSIGTQVAYILYYEHEYENLILSNIKNNENIVSGGFANKIDFGLRMTRKSKKIGCSNIKALIENDMYTVVDYATINELQTFSKKNDSYEAEEGKFDDIAMTLVIFGWLSTQEYFKDLYEFNARELIVNRNIKALMEDLTPIGIYVDPANDAEFEKEIDENMQNNTTNYW
jgi:hypothetical protein